MLMSSIEVFPFATYHKPRGKRLVLAYFPLFHEEMIMVERKLWSCISVVFFDISPDLFHEYDDTNFLLCVCSCVVVW